MIKNMWNSDDSNIVQGDDAPLVEHEDEAQIYRTLEELVNEDNYKEFYYQASLSTISKLIIN